MKQEFHLDIFDIRQVNDSDKELLRDIVDAEYLLGKVYSVAPDIATNVYWDDVINRKNDLNFLVFLKNGDLLGRVALQKIDKDIPELAIVIIKKYQSQGYGTSLVKQFLDWIYDTMGYSQINIKIDNSNQKSIGLFKKIGMIVDKEDSIIFGHLNLPFYLV